MLAGCFQSQLECKSRPLGDSRRAEFANFKIVSNFMWYAHCYGQGMNRIVTILIPVMFTLTAVALGSSADAKTPLNRSEAKLAPRPVPKPVEPKTLAPKAPTEPPDDSWTSFECKDGKCSCKGAEDCFRLGEFASFLCKGSLECFGGSCSC